MAIRSDPYISEPAHVNLSLADAIIRLDEPFVLAMASEVTARVMELIGTQQKSLAIQSTGNRIPILNSLDDVSSILSHCSRVCIVLYGKLVLIWSDSPSDLIEVGTDVEKKLLDQLFGHDEMALPVVSPRPAESILSFYVGDQRSSSIRTTRVLGPSMMEITALVRCAMDEKNEIYMKAVALEEKDDEDDGDDLEGQVGPRPHARVHTVKVSLAIMLVILTQILGVSKVSWN